MTVKKVVISDNSAKVLAFFDEVERKKQEMRKKIEKRLNEKRHAGKRNS